MRGFVTGEVAATARTEKPPIIRLLRPDEEAANRAHDDVTEKAALLKWFLSRIGATLTGFDG